MNITRNSLCVDSYTVDKLKISLKWIINTIWQEERWINKNNKIKKCSTHQDLKENEWIELTLTFKNSSLTYILETRTDVAEDNVDLDIPVSLTQYIEVRKYLWRSIFRYL